jgi:riboflavin biosynthesis pyrimidine reductase
VQFTRLLPERATVDASDLLAALSASRAPAQRPYAIANFVASADGHIATQGRSGALSDPGDRALFHMLREHADAVLAGTNTLAVESYGRMIKSEEARARRLAAGRSAEPLACVISASGVIPLGIPLFAEPEAHIVLFSPTAPEPGTSSARIDFVQTDPHAGSPLREALRTLRVDFDVRTLLFEGGPTLMRSLLTEGLLDELFLTLAPRLTGGGEPSLIAPPPLPELLGLRLRWLLHREDSLYARYAIPHA